MDISSAYDLKRAKALKCLTFVESFSIVFRFSHWDGLTGFRLRLLGLYILLTGFSSEFYRFAQEEVIDTLKLL